MQYITDTVTKEFADGNKINVGELRNAAQAQANFNGMLEEDVAVCAAKRAGAGG